MKYFALLTFLIFASYLLEFIKKSEKYQWMDRKYTTAIKGFSILTVVWAHSGARLSVGGIQFIAGIGVALFLMCSGYGLEVSYEKNGLKGFWRKRLLGVCLPFWVVELVEMLAIGSTFSIKTYLLDFCFLRQATAYGWFMGYIVICYLIFYAVKKLVKHSRTQTLVLFGAFAIWFVLESIFFANPDMPFLRARQMLSFPAGVLLAVNKEQIEQTLTKTKNILVLTGGTVCLLFMAITQLNAVKSMPYIVSNAKALLTCLPMAIGIMAFGKSFGGLFENKMLAVTGMISYEIYLVHAFTLGMIKPSATSVIAFVMVTVTLAYTTYFTIGKIKNGKFNNYYPHKE